MTPEEIIHRLVQAQKRAGIKDRALARAAGIGPATWPRIIKGERRPSLAVVCAVADALGVSITVSDLVDLPE